MASAYQIRDWKRHFEVNQSRSIKGALPWIATKTKHDGKGFRRMMAMKDGAALYGAFILMAQVAGKCPVKGLLADQDGPLTTDDLFAKTGCPAKTFDKSIQVCMSQGIAWIEEVIDYSLMQDDVADYSELSSRNGTVRDGTVRNESTYVRGCELNCLGDFDESWLSHASALCGFHRVAHSERPDCWPNDERTLVKLLSVACHVRANSKTSKMGLFRTMIAKIDEARLYKADKDAAVKMLADHRQYISAERAAGREPNINLIPLCDDRKDSR